MDSDFFETTDDYTVVKIRVTTRSSRNTITGVNNGRLCVSVTSVPENGKANETIVKIFSKKLKCAKTKINIISGEKSRDKILKIGVPLNLEYLNTENPR
ncbi:MAG: YggU family protein [Alphaproteobacteria bacterium]|nr:YggU family protein [Alphaproteobacteria bacterium]